MRLPDLKMGSLAEQYKNNTKEDLAPVGDHPVPNDQRVGRGFPMPTQVNSPTIPNSTAPNPEGVNGMAVNSAEQVETNNTARRLTSTSIDLQTK